MDRMFMIDEEQLEMLERLQRRLHSEQRMNGDEMRDAGHIIHEVVRRVKDNEITDDMLKG